MPGEIKSSVTAFRQATGLSGGTSVLRVCCECVAGKVCVKVAKTCCKAGGGCGGWGGGMRPLPNTLKSPLMNIKKAFGSRQLCHKFANQRNVSVCAEEELSQDIN